MSFDFDNLITILIKQNSNEFINEYRNCDEKSDQISFVCTIGN